MINQELLLTNFAESKNKLSKLINDDKFNELLEKELIFLKNVNNDIYAKINNNYIAHEFINNYLEKFENIFNQLSNEKFSIIINATDDTQCEITVVNLDNTGINKEQTFDNIIEGKFNEEAISYSKKIIQNNK
jgi:chromosomal replication initiation ATPase DnaA